MQVIENACNVCGGWKMQVLQVLEFVGNGKWRVRVRVRVTRADILKVNPGTCPVCRTSIQMVMQLYG